MISVVGSSLEPLESEVETFAKIERCLNFTQFYTL